MKTYKITNKTYDSIPLVGLTITGRNSIETTYVSTQMRNLEKKGLLSIKEVIKKKEVEKKVESVVEVIKEDTSEEIGPIDESSVEEDDSSDYKF